MQSTRPSRNSQATATTIRPRLARRKQDAELLRKAATYNLPRAVALAIAGRGISADADVATFLEAPISVLDNPMQLKGMTRAAARVAKAVINGEMVGLESDYDQDGLGAMTTFKIAFTSLFHHPPDRLKSYVGHRLRDGYGLCEPIAKRILDEDERPSVLITADNGSSDEPRIQLLAEHGIDVIVTDHHAIPVEGPPKSAYACINPQQHDCRYPDKSVAGGMVAWLLMCAVRQSLVDEGWLDNDRNRLGELLDFVACSTVADCVSMASMNNRALVKFGLRLMNERPRSCWQGMQSLLRGKSITAETIAFGIAPRVNAQTRLNSADEALNFLLAEDIEEAARCARVLDANNEERKAIEKTMVDEAAEIADEQFALGRRSIVVLLEDGHPGVQGICSSRIQERYGRPAFTFCPNIDDLTVLTGSGRSGEYLHLRDALQGIADRAPGLMEKFGGHRAAAGVTLGRDDFEKFCTLFELEACQRIEGRLGPVLWSDGELNDDELSLTTLEALAVLEPTGRGFEAAQFDGEFEVLAARAVGDGTHLKVTLRSADATYAAIWFRAVPKAGDPAPVAAGSVERFVYRLMDNSGYGRRRLELQILGVVDDP